MTGQCLVKVRALSLSFLLPYSFWCLLSLLPNPISASLQSLPTPQLANYFNPLMSTVVPGFRDVPPLLSNPVKKFFLISIISSRKPSRIFSPVLMGEKMSDNRFSFYF